MYDYWTPITSCVFPSAGSYGNIAIDADVRTFSVSVSVSLCLSLSSSNFLNPQRYLTLQIYVELLFPPEALSGDANRVIPSLIPAANDSVG